MDLDEKHAHIDFLCDRLNTPDFVRGDAHELLDANPNQFRRGKHTEAGLLAIVFLAARIRNLPVTIRDFCRAISLNMRDVSRAYRDLLEENEYDVPVQSPLQFISKLSNACNFSPKTVMNAQKTLTKNPKECALIGHDAQVRAATVLLHHAYKNKEVEGSIFTAEKRVIQNKSRYRTTYGEESRMRYERDGKVWAVYDKEPPPQTRHIPDKFKEHNKITTLLEVANVSGNGLDKNLLTLRKALEDV
tara:strand:+ start:2650 stop:3387 length:738 start_codon:yes stop_codon:yes gene_type:complete